MLNRPFKFNKLSPSMIGFAQATGIAIYCGAVGLLLWNGEKLFGKFDTFVGPFLLLCILVVSVLICGILAFGQAVKVFFDKKSAKDAVKIVVFTAGWLGLYISIVINLLIFF